MLAISLIFVGITLVLNGVFSLWQKDSKSLIILNLFTASIIIIFNIYAILISTIDIQLIGYMGGLLFGLTNLLIAFDLIFKADTRGTGVFCLLATIVAVCLALYYFLSADALRGGAWAMWSLIWLFAFIGFVLSKNFLKATYLMFIVQGVLTTGAFGVLQLFKIINF